MTADSGTFSLEIVCACGTVSPVAARFCSACGRALAAATALTAVGSDEPKPADPRGSWPAISRGDVGVTIPHARWFEERRRVTALFADLAGFTSLAGRLEPEDLLAVIDPVITGLAQIVDRYDGYLEKFAGDAVLALFGAPVAHEDDSARALHVAAEMHARIAELSSQPDAAELALHIGINTGVAIARSIESGGRAQYAVLGESVILAQRLQSLAPVGQTYVGELTMQLAQDHFEFEKLGLRPVKGRSDPVPVYRVRGRRQAQPARSTLRTIGRDRDLNVLLDALRAARDGISHVAHLVGPAGSGKSHLMAQLRDHPAADGVLWVEIVGESYAQAAYRGVVTLFAAALAARYPGGSSTAARLRHLAADPFGPASVEHTSLLVGERTDPSALTDVVPQEVGRQLFDAAKAWLADLCSRQDVVVAVDNAQWLEPSTVDLLRELMWALPAANLLFCLSGRPPKPTFDAAASVTVEFLSLEPNELRQLIVEELSLLPDDHLTACVYDRSQGNPLMAVETIRHLRDEHLLDAHHGHVRLITGAGPGSVPANLETLLAARIDTMHPESIRVATAAAAIGLVVPVPLLQAVSDLEADRFQMGMSELIDVGFATGHGPAVLRFDSPPIRDVLYSRLTARRRRALHARIASMVEMTVASPDVAAPLLAEHLFLAGDVLGALPLLRQVAEHARQVHAHDDAAVALTRAVEAARATHRTDDDTVSILLCDLADLRMELGEYDLAEELYREAQQDGGNARAFAGRGAALRRQGRYADAQAQLRAALAERPVGDVRLIWGELSAVLAVSGDLPAGLDTARTGLSLGRTDDRVAGLLYARIVRAETLLCHFEAAAESAARAIENFERAGDQPGLCTALRLLGSLQQSAGQLDEAAATLERGLALAERIGLVEEIGGCLINLGLVKGALDDHQAAAECYARAAVTFERADNLAGQATAYGNGAFEQFVLGQPERASELADRAMRLAAEVGNHLVAADVHHTLGLIGESRGDFAAALAHANAAIGEFELAAMPDSATPSRELAQRARDAQRTKPGRA